MHRTYRRPEKNPQRPQTKKIKTLKKIKFVVHKPPFKKTDTHAISQFVDS